MTAPRFDPVSLAARIRAVSAEIDALDATRGAKDLERRRLINQLARHPGEEPEALAPRPRAIPIKAAVGLSGKSADTLRRHGVPGGWVWKQGGRVVVDLAGLDEFLNSPRGRS